MIVNGPRRHESSRSRIGILISTRAHEDAVGRVPIYAYGVRDVQVIGGPGWMKTNRYDINAVRPANATRDQLPGMMRNLLMERFALKVHHETRDLPAANLVVARSDRKLGPHLQSATDADADCNVGRDALAGQDQLGAKLEFRRIPLM